MTVVGKALSRASHAPAIVGTSMPLIAANKTTWLGRLTIRGLN